MGRLWDALRKKGRQVRVIGIGAENETVDRTARVLRAWASAAPKETGEGPAVKQEIKAIGEAMTHGDMEASPPPEDDPPSFNASRKQRSRKASRIDDLLDLPGQPVYGVG